MKPILFITHKEQQCGVYQFGKRVFNLLVQDTTVPYIYAEVDSITEYRNLVNTYQPEAIIYNWHSCTMGWLSEQEVVNDHRKHYFIYHDCSNVRANYDYYFFFGAYGNGTIPLEKSILVPRPLFKTNYEVLPNDTLTVGSFGFGFWHKGFDKIVDYMNNNYDRAVINLHIPNAHFGDISGNETRAVADKCREINRRKNLTLNITHNFLTDEETLLFLSKNDVNMFYYGYNANDGIASVIDYALSVNRPIAIQNTPYLRHVYKPEIDWSLNSVEDIVKLGTTPLEDFYTRWSNDNFIKEFHSIFTRS